MRVQLQASSLFNPPDSLKAKQTRFIVSMNKCIFLHAAVTALIIQSCGVLSVSWSCCKADFADSETMKAEDKEADGSLGPFPKVLFDPGKLSHLLAPADSPVSALMCCLDTRSAFSSLVSLQRCMWATWHCTLVGICTYLFRA